MKAKTAIDFSYFSSQRILKMELRGHYPFLLTFDHGGICIECPWRLVRHGSLVLGQTDLLSAGEQYKEQLEELLVGTKIVKVAWLEGTSMLRIHLENDCILDLFHNSVLFEGWDLFGDNGFSFISLPGGEYDFSH